MSTWFRDYLYIPLGGSRGSTWIKVRNTFIIFIVSGFWHGANWTFIVWGALNAIYFSPLLLTKNNRNNFDVVAKGKIFPSFMEFISITLTFWLTALAWIFFRATTIDHALSYISRIFTPALFTVPDFPGAGRALKTLIVVILFVIMEWQGREGQYAIENLGLKWKRPLRRLMYFVIIIMIFWFGQNEQQFIYFQF